MRTVSIGVLIAFCMGCGEAKTKIVISDSGFTINGASLSMPADFVFLKQALGAPSRISKTVNDTDMLVWDELGILAAGPDSNGMIWEICLYYNERPRDDSAPAKAFEGSLRLSGFDVKDGRDLIKPRILGNGFSVSELEPSENYERSIGGVRCFVLYYTNSKTIQVSLCSSEGPKL